MDKIFTQTIIENFLYILRWLIYSLLFIPFKTLNTKNLRHMILVLGVVVVSVGLTQYFIYPDMRWLKDFGWDDHYYRLIGSFLDPNFTGIIIVLFLIFLLETSEHWLLWSTSFLALALTYSRSSYLAFLISMTYIAWKRKSWQFITLILLLFTVTVTLLPRSSSGEGVKLERTASVYSRFTNWQDTWTIFLKHPILGAGFSSFKSDSSLLYILAAAGIPGLLLYLVYLKNIPPVYLVPLLVHSLFVNSLFYPPVMVWLSLLIAFQKRSQNGH